MTDDLVQRLADLDPVLETDFDTQISVERDPYGATQAIEKALYLLRDQAARIEQLTAERDRLREALAMIDAIDPEHHIDGCAQTVVRGLVLRMGETARAALKGEGHE